MIFCLGDSAIPSTSTASHRGWPSNTGPKSSSRLTSPRSTSCPSTLRTGPIPAAINQLRRYANQREVGQPEGNERLFWSSIYPKLAPLQVTGEGGGALEVIVKRITE